MSGRTAVVTGGAGFVGSHVTAALLAEGWQVVVLDDLTTGHDWQVPGKAQFVQFDVRSDRWPVIGCDVVVHLAAIADSRSADPMQVASVNVGGTIEALEFARGCGARFVLASSCAVYGECPSDGADETYPARVRQPYAVSKLCAELWTYARSTEDVILRLGNVYGPNDHRGVVGVFSDLIGQNGLAEVFGDGHQVRDFVYVRDVADAFVRAAAASGHGHLVVNVGSGVGTSVLRLADLCWQARHGQPSAGELPPRPIFLAERADEVRCSLLKVGRARTMLGWEASTPLPHGLELIVGA